MFVVGLFLGFITALIPGMFVHLAIVARNSRRFLRETENIIRLLKAGSGSE